MRWALIGRLNCYADVGDRTPRPSKKRPLRSWSLSSCDVAAANDRLTGCIQSERFTASLPPSVSARRRTPRTRDAGRSINASHVQSHDQLTVGVRQGPAGSLGVTWLHNGKVRSKTGCIYFQCVSVCVCV